MVSALIPLELYFSFSPWDSQLFNALWKLVYEITNCLGGFPDWSFLDDMSSTWEKFNFIWKDRSIFYNVIFNLSSGTLEEGTRKMVSVLIQKNYTNKKISFIPSDTNEFIYYNMTSIIFNLFWECKPRKKELLMKM